MQKKVIAGLCAVAMAFATATTSPAIDNGTWDLSTGVQNGFWQENFSGGGPGQPGNVLTGGDGVPLDQWLVGFGLTLANTTPGVNPGEYWTTYSGGQLNLLAGGPWGDGASFYPLTALNHSISGAEGALWFEIEMTGSIMNEPTGQSVSVRAVFDSRTANSYDLITQQGVVKGHKGSGFKELSVTVSGVPDSGSSLALLCPVLVGLVAWGRMKISKQ